MEHASSEKAPTAHMPRSDVRLASGARDVSCFLLPVRGGAGWQLVGLITRRSEVQILPPLPNTAGARERVPAFSFPSPVPDRSRAPCRGRLAVWLAAAHSAPGRGTMRPSQRAPGSSFGCLRPCAPDDRSSPPSTIARSRCTPRLRPRLHRRRIQPRLHHEASCLHRPLRNSFMVCPPRRGSVLDGSRPRT